MIFRKDEALPLPHIISSYKKERILCQCVRQQNEAHSNYVHSSKNLVLLMPHPLSNNCSLIPLRRCLACGPEGLGSRR